MQNLDKEAQEKIAELLYDQYMGYDFGLAIKRPLWRASKDMQDEMYMRAARIILKFTEELGYSKLPEGEPPLLSDVIIRERTKNCVGLPYESVKENIEWLAQAQRDSDIEWYGGEG